MFNKYRDTARRIIEQECFPSNKGHEYCEALFINHFGTTDLDYVEKHYPDWMMHRAELEDETLFTIGAVMLPSPDGRMWNEVHHIDGRARSNRVRAISHELHQATHNKGTIIESPKPIFHCIKTAVPWAIAYDAKSSIELPYISTEEEWMIRVLHEYHSHQGVMVDQASTQLNQLVVDEIHEYIWNVRSFSWDDGGTIKKENICPSPTPPAHPDWSKEIVDQMNSWYQLSTMQKQYLRWIAQAAGSQGSFLIRNGMTVADLRESTESYRLAQAVTRLARWAYDSSEPTKNAKRVVRIFYDTKLTATSQADHAEKLMDAYDALNPKAEKPFMVKKAYADNETIVIATFLERNEDNEKLALAVGDINSIDTILSDFKEWKQQ